MMRAVVAVCVLVAACSGVQPVEPIGSTTGSMPSGPVHAEATADDAGGSASSAADTASGETVADDTAGGETAPPATAGSGSEGPCPVGTEGCACTAEDSCDPGLACLSHFCVDTGQRCPVGAEGCPCTQGGACDPGLECASMVCVDPM